MDGGSIIWFSMQENPQVNGTLIGVPDLKKKGHAGRVETNI
jgi:hypothetical protein